MKVHKDTRRTRNWQRKILAISRLLVLFFLLVPLVVTPSTKAVPFVGNSGYIIIMKLKVEFTDTDSGVISFYLGTTEKDKLEITASDELDLDFRIFNGHISYDVHKFFWEKLFPGSSSRNFENINFSMIMKGILDSDDELQLMDPNITFYTNGREIGVELSSGFKSIVESSKREYTYLKFTHDSDLAQELSFTNMEKKYWEGKDYAWIRIEIDSTDPVSMSFEEISLDHTRSRTGESYLYKTTYTKFTADNNKVMVHDTTLKSPSLLFYVFLLTIIIGYLLLVVIWIKKKFKGKGRVLPVTTILISVIVWLGYFYPGFAFYSIGGISYYIYSGIFLLMVLSCSFINLSPSIKKGYHIMKEEEERIEEVPIIDIPLVNYVQTTVTVSESPDGRDQYQILGVDEGATVEEIKKAYLEKIKDYHPDRYQDSPERIKLAAETEAALLNQVYENIMKSRGERK